MLTHEEKVTADAMVAQVLPKADLPDPIITMSLSIDDIKHLHKLPNMVPVALLAVIGYLTTYAASGGFKSALLYRDRNDIMAVYERHNGSKFVMCGVWDEYTQKWGTHS